VAVGPCRGGLTVGTSMILMSLVNTDSIATSLTRAT
jgi:hypothetical protein